MKVKFSQFIFAFLICFSFYNFTFGQEKFVALKFDEFITESKKSEDDDKHFNRFAAQLKKLPQMFAVIIRYSSRKQVFRKSNYWNAERYLQSALRELENLDIAEARIKTIDGGIREKETLEFWVMPKGADLPQPRSEFIQSDIIYCINNFYVEGADYTFDRNKILEFSANIYEENPSQKLSYHWETSIGKIVEGQGTAKIKVNVSGTVESYLIIKLNINGLALECKNQAVKNVTLAKAPFKFAELSGQGEDFKIYPHYLLQELSANPQLQAKMFVYAPRNGGSNILKIGIERAKRTMQFIQFPPEKLPIEIGGFRGKLTFEIWIYPKNTEPPKPTPTVDEKFVAIPKQINKPR